MNFVVTFDVFSALIDSRTGGSAFFGALAKDRGWETEATRVYDTWDARNKALHRECAEWVPFADLAETALRATYDELGLPGDATDSAGLLASMAEWPLWPDVTAESIRRLGADVGLLTNIDDALLAETAVIRLGVFEPDLVVTSERLHAYKPSADFYRLARETVGPFVHVASSARDVRGALEAGIPSVRLARSGHVVDPAGPKPPHEVSTVDALPGVLAEAAGQP